jgi:hypothetical protein
MAQSVADKLRFENKNKKLFLFSTLSELPLLYGRLKGSNFGYKSARA